MAVNGKQKGASYERQICKALSLWLSHGQREDILWRSAMSGGRATVMHKGGKSNKSQAGDISSVDGMGHELTDQLTIECKFYKSLDLGPSILTGKGRLANFWRQAVTQAARSRKQPLLIAKQNFYPDLLLTTGAGADILGLTFSVHQGKTARSPLAASNCISDRTVYVYTLAQLLGNACPFGVLV